VDLMMMKILFLIEKWIFKAYNLLWFVFVKGGI